MAAPAAPMPPPMETISSDTEIEKKITPQEWKKNEVMNVEKSHKSACVCPVFYPSLRGPLEV